MDQSSPHHMRSYVDRVDWIWEAVESSTTSEAGNGHGNRPPTYKHCNLMKWESWNIIEKQRSTSHDLKIPTIQKKKYTETWAPTILPFLSVWTAHCKPFSGVTTSHESRQLTRCVEPLNRSSIREAMTLSVAGRTWCEQHMWPLQTLTSRRLHLKKYEIS